jgi:hypothetical protein
MVLRKKKLQIIIHKAKCEESPVMKTYYTVYWNSINKSLVHQD